MSQSYPSKKAIITDVPEVTGFKGKFVYNFFTPDERLNGGLTTLRSSIRDRIKGLDPSNVAGNLSSFDRFVPRYVKFSWSPVVTVTDPRTSKDVAGDISIAANRHKIYDEETFAIEDFKNVSFQDTQIDQKMGFFVQRLIQDIVNKNKVTRQTPMGQMSLMDLTEYANRNTSPTVAPDFLADALHDLHNGSIKYFNQANNKLLTDNILTDLRTVRTDVQINKKFLNTVLQTSRENPINIYYDEISNQMLDQARIEQESAVKNNSSTMIRGSDYDIEIANYVDLKLVNSDFYESQSHVIGYIIEKTEIPQSNSGPIIHPEIIVETPFVGETIDFEVKYGSKYIYKIYTVVSFDVRSVNVDTSQVVAVTFLMRSKPTIQIITCDEAVVPPPPADFNVIWDYVKRKPSVTWSFPVNTQRDIKYFQVFRRKTVDDPFELLALYDFDDSMIRTAIQESDIRGYLTNDDASLVNKTDSTHYRDDEFKQYEDSYIYTVCSVDAHGYSSNYSTQIQVKFNRATNSLDKKIISKSGAPKPYPNMNILEDLFVDTIKTSGAKRMHIYFTPEYLDVYKIDGGKKNSLHLLNTSKKLSDGNVYRVQMINVDLQKQEIFGIRVDDKRQ